jgi:hypothetical protein
MARKAVKRTARSCFSPHFDRGMQKKAWSIWWADAAATPLFLPREVSLLVFPTLSHKAVGVDTEISE